MRERTKERPWSIRRPVALWRGGTSGKSCWDGRVGAPIDVQKDTSSSTHMHDNCYRHQEESSASSSTSSDTADRFKSKSEVCAVEKLSDEDEAGAAEDEEREHTRNGEGAEGTKLSSNISPPPPPCGRRALRLEAATRSTRHLFDVAYSYMRVEDQLSCQALVYAEGHCG